MNYIKKLENIGFSKNEAKVYLACLKLGQVKVSLLANNLDIPRTSIYIYIKKLLEKGYLKKSRRKGIEYFSPVEPSYLFKDVKEKVDNFFSVLPDLENLLDFSSQKPKVEYFDTRAGLIKVYQSLLYKNYKKPPFFIESGQALKYLNAKKDMDEKFHYNWQKKFLARGVSTQGIITEKTISLLKKMSSQTKKIYIKRPIIAKVINEEELPFSIILYLFYPDNVFIITPKNDFALMIQDENIYSSFFTLVKLLSTKARNFNPREEIR
jgi:sugar-specific transcriptional regulator TrmB